MEPLAAVWRWRAVHVATVCAVLLALLGPTSARPAHADATFTVTSTGDQGDNFPDNSR